ncbi:MAG: protease complex subunit PrcB family protein [Gemmatimonadetes bacterium]|nr:protease complex subunit PrcB family protein [Gemmatimonadota bacterium]
MYSHDFGSLEQPVRCVVRRAEDWAALWTAMRRNVHVSPPAPPPPVDFGARMVLLAGMGTRPTAGYGIAITGVRRTGAGVVVQVVQSTTGGCEVGMAETEPIHAVSIPRADAPVQFVENVRYGSHCEPP